jgi:exopolysaccharide biosynthesis polyprenyl glycosylphosphotransferase
MIPARDFSPDVQPIPKSVATPPWTPGGISDPPPFASFPDSHPPEQKHRAKRRDEPFLRGRWIQVCYALIDVAVISLNAVAAYALRFHFIGLWKFLSHSQRLAVYHHYGAFLLLQECLILLLCQSQRLYRTPLTRPQSEEFTAVAKAVSLASLLLAGFIFLSGVTIVSRLVIATSAALDVPALFAWRYLKRRVILHRIERGIGARNALIVGAGKVGQALALYLESNKMFGYRFVGFLDGNHATDPRLLGKPEDLHRVARAQFADEVFVTIPSERELVKRVVAEAQREHLSVNVIPELFDGLGWNARIRRLGDFPVMDLHLQPIPTIGLLLKRTMDVVLSAIGLILCIPLFAAIALAIRIDSPGPILYCAPRAGRKGRAFRCLKFRTMIVDADRFKDGLRSQNERLGPIFKIANDPRITNLGRFLRRYSLDELPQLWNVLIGEMSLVGPRPHPLDDFRRYNLDHRRRLEVKPGMTGLWQVTARSDPSFDTSMRLDLQYIDGWNLRSDLAILSRTFGAVMRAEGC